MISEYMLQFNLNCGAAMNFNYTILRLYAIVILVSICHFDQHIFIDAAGFKTGHVKRYTTEDAEHRYKQDVVVNDVKLRQPCLPKDFGRGSVVCVCSDSYCDSQPSVSSSSIPRRGFIQIVSSEDGFRFETFYKSLKENSSCLFNQMNAAATLNVNRSLTYQKIIGFGGAFTDAAGINFAGTSEILQRTLIKSYYGKGGLEYNVGRVPIGGSDFSTRPYTYSDDFVNDTSLEHFSLTLEDYLYKIPFIKIALKLNPSLKLFASPWSAPAWMKTNKKLSGGGSLKLEYYQTWANYFTKFLDAYAKENINFWAVTTQNEPLDGFLPFFPFNCMAWTAAKERDWVKNNLGPTLQRSQHSDVKIIIMDDQRFTLFPWAKTVLSDPEAAKYVSGIGIHWYFDTFVPPIVLQKTHSKFPGYFLFGTEACAGAGIGSKHVILGDWSRAEDYANDIIQDLNNFVAGWTDWNLALDMQGGPNWVNNFVDSPVHIDKENNIAYKQPMFYAMGHFSKYLPENSVRIHNEGNLRGLKVVTCQRPDGAITTVILNKMSESVPLILKDSEGVVISTNIGPKSIHTYIFN